MKKRMIFGVAALIISVLLQAGCAVTTSSEVNTNKTSTQEKSGDPAAKERDNQKKIMEEFNKLAEQENKVENIIGFIDNNISKVSKEDASDMIVKLEEIQKKNMHNFEEKLGKEDIQKKFIEVHKIGTDINKIENIKDTQLKELVTEVKNSGFKIETAEGMYFPVINYEFYKKYSTVVTPDIKGFIDIMAVESNIIPAKDAALMISWNEIIKRGLEQEKFMDQYPNSKKINDVSQLYKKYMTFALYGANNTPLFDYQSKTLNPKAKSAYLNLLKEESGSKTIKTIRDFMDLLEKSNYKLTKDIESFRKSVIN